VRVLLSTYDSRGGIEPLVALGVRLQALGAEVLVFAPPDCTERLAEVGVPLVPAGEPVRSLVHRATPPSPDDVPRLAAELIATWFDKVAAAAEGCDALVASGVIPAAVGARSVAEKLGMHSVHVSYCPILLPSPRHRLHPLPGRPLPPDVTDNRVLWELDAQGYNAVFGPALNAHRIANGLAGLAPVDDRDDCFAVGEVNQQALFGRVAAVVHHGGAGTTATAARAGAPQVVPGRRAPGGSAPVGGPAILGQPGGRPGHRRGLRRSGSDYRVPVSRAQDGPDPRDPRTSGRRGRRDPHRRGDDGRDAAGRRDQPGKAARAHVNHAGPSSQEHPRTRTANPGDLSDLRSELVT
jgi:hypothetical protein